MIKTENCLKIPEKSLKDFKIYRRASRGGWGIPIGVILAIPLTTTDVFNLR